MDFYKMESFVDFYAKLDEYRDLLDDIYEPVKYGELTFFASRIIEELDPVAFTIGFREWLEENPEEEFLDL